MSKYDVALVTLALNDNDIPVLKYASYVAEKIGLKKIYFLHVEDSLEIPKNIRDKFPDLIPPLDESFEADMKRVVGESFTAKVDVDYKVEEGGILKETLHYASVKNVDLIITGNCTNLSKTSFLSTKLASKAPCSVLAVPYSAEPKFGKVLAPVDFSENVDRVYTLTQELKGLDGVEAKLLHVYQVPTGYAKAGRSFEEFSDIMEANAKDEYKDLCDRLNTQVDDVALDIVENDDAPKMIREVIEKESIDLVVLGARGRGVAAQFVLGSVTEELLLSTKVPIFALKEKGENMSVLKALFGF